MNIGIKKHANPLVIVPNVSGSDRLMEALTRLPA
jgi:hypothetical protein